MSILENLFLHVIDTAIIATIIIIVTLLLKYLLKTKFSANWHLMIWIVLIIKLVVPFLPTSIYSIEGIVDKITSKHLFLSQNFIEENQKISTPVPVKNSTKLGEQGSKDNASYQHEIDKFSISQVEDSGIGHVFSKYFCFFFYTWLIGAVLFYCYIVMIKILMDKKIRTTVSDEKCIRDKVEYLFEELICEGKVKKRLPIVFQTFLLSPAIFGFIKPKLLLNDNLIKSLDDSELRHILFHEIFHYKRKDYLLNTLLIVLQGIYWFNPFIWIAFSKIRLDCEVCCDRNVLKKIGNQDYKKYAETLIKVLDYSSNSKLNLATIGVIEDKSNITWRFTMLNKVKKMKVLWIIIAALALSGMSVVFLTKNVEEEKVIYSNNVKNLDVDDKSNSIKIVDFEKGKDDRRFNGKVALIPDAKKVKVGYSFTDSGVNKRTSDMAKENGAICAINAAGYYDNLKPMGVIMQEGKFVYCEDKEVDYKFDIVGLDEDGILVAGKYTKNEILNSRIKEVVSFGPVIVANGEGVIKKGDGGWGIAPRTAIGQKKDRTVIFLVINGRNTDSLGASLLDVQQIMLENGAVNAAILDGGSSTTMYYNGKVVNVPSDPEGERKVPSVFMALP
jgi:bla regulator protein BlaR1